MVSHKKQWKSQKDVEKSRKDEEGRGLRSTPGRKIRMDKSSRSDPGPSPSPSLYPLGLAAQVFVFEFVFLFLFVFGSSVFAHPLFTH